MNKIKHYIIIRFYNENFNVIPLERMLDFDFLNAAANLLKNNCLVSLENQTNKNFEVIIIINDLIKDDHKIYSVLNNLNCSFPIHIMKKNDMNLLINNINDYDYVITTRIDHDDFAKNTAVEEIQNLVKNEIKYPYLIYGYQNGIAIIGDDITTTREYLPKYQGPMSVMISLVINRKLTSDVFSIYKLGDHSRLHNSIKKLYKEKNLEYTDDVYCINKEHLSYLYVKTGYNASMSVKKEWGDVNHPVTKSKDWYKNKFGVDLK